MKRVTYVGLDVHLQWIVGVWKDEQGKVFVDAVENKVEGWEKLVEGVKGEKVVAAYEASGCGFNLHDWLRAKGWEVYVVAPTHLERSRKERKTKTDVRDAKRLMEKLAAHLELGHELVTVWVPPNELREDRAVVRRRLKLGEKLTEAKNEIVSLLRMHGVRRPEELKTLWTRKYVAWLRGLCGESGALAGSVKRALESLVRELEFFEAEEKKVNEEVEALARKEEYRNRMEKMTEISGVGTLTAITFLTELGDPKRFSNSRKVGSYLGLVPACYESMNERKGRITRMGPARVRKVLNQAAWAYLRENAEPRARYEKLSSRRGKKKAVVAVMRHLGIELWKRAVSA